MIADALRERKRELLAQKERELARQTGNAGDRLALYIINEEILDINAHLKALTPGYGHSRGGRQRVPANRLYAVDQQQYSDWLKEDQSPGDVIADGRMQMRKSAASSLKSLTPRQRQMIEMYYFQGKNGVQIAEELGVHRSIVSRTLASARKYMQNQTEQVMTVTSLLKDGALNLSDLEAARIVLSVMTPTQAVYFFLRYSEGLSSSQIAEITGTLRSTVSRTLNRAQKNIGALFSGGDVILECPEALDEMAYQTYLKIADRLEQILAETDIPIKPPVRCRAQRGAEPTRVQVQQPRKGAAPGKLLPALEKRRDKQSGYSILRCLEVIFMALYAEMEADGRS